jgi:hypothetical protein
LSWRTATECVQNSSLVTHFYNYKDVDIISPLRDTHFPLHPTTLFCVFYTDVPRKQVHLGLWCPHISNQQQDQFSVGARFSAPVQNRPGAHPAFYTLGTESFPGVKPPGSGADHLPPASAMVEGTVELYIAPLLAFMGCSVVLWRTGPMHRDILEYNIHTYFS